jgi:putative transposase
VKFGEYVISTRGRKLIMDVPLCSVPICSVRYEKIFLEEYETVAELITGLKEYFEFYNFERSHQSFSRKTPTEVY